MIYTIWYIPYAICHGHGSSYVLTYIVYSIIYHSIYYIVYKSGIQCHIYRHDVIMTCQLELFLNTLHMLCTI
jgi:hypothetical protein